MTLGAYCSTSMQDGTAVCGKQRKSWTPCGRIFATPGMSTRTGSVTNDECNTNYGNANGESWRASVIWLRSYIDLPHVTVTRPAPPTPPQGHTHHTLLTPFRAHMEGHNRRHIYQLRDTQRTGEFVSLGRALRYVPDPSTARTPPRYPTTRHRCSNMKMEWHYPG